MQSNRYQFKREKSTTTVGHYVKNADLLPAVIEAKQLGRITDNLITMIRLIADRYSRRSNFVGYSFREDMVSSAVENLCKNALKFNHEKYDNPFAFYTTAIHRSFLQYLAEEKNHRKLRDKLLIDAGSNPSFNFLDQEKDESHFEVKESDEIRVSNKELDDPLEEVVPMAIDPTNGEIVPIVQKETKIQYRDRAPGKIIRYNPEDIEIDPVTGSVTIKQGAIASKIIDPMQEKKADEQLDNQLVAVKATSKKPFAKKSATKKSS